MTDMQSSSFEISAADKHIIYGTRWHPPTDIRGVIQIFHGLGEHHLRYERFSAAATARGFAVVVHDHRGHGVHAEELGHFADSDGWKLLIDDGLEVNRRIGDWYDGLPVTLLGHSMGSYVAQRFAMFHDSRITALVLSASTWPSTGKIIPGRLIAFIEALRVGRRGKSGLLHKLGFGDFNKRFEPARTELDWLSRDESEVDKYVSDPLCGGPYSCGLWLDLMGGLLEIASDNELLRIRSDLPILISGGSADPVGGDKGMTRLAMHYAQTSHSQMSLRIYPDGRHEMFNESNRAEFTAELLDWIENLYHA